MRPATRGSERQTDRQIYGRKEARTSDLRRYNYRRTDSTLAGEHEQLPGRGRGAAEPPEPEAIGSTDVCVHSRAL